MVDKNELRAAFSIRLHEALDDAGARRRGRGTDIQKHLKSAGVSRSAQAISKWLNGEAMAEADSMIALSEWLNVRREWLEYGVLPKRLKGNINGLHPDAEGEVDDIKSQYHHRIGMVRMLSWSQVTACREEAIAEPMSESWLYCPVPISKNGYALKVFGDSMTNPGPGRSYPSGCIIFIDPDAKIQTGDRVIARVPQTNQVTFKILVEDGGKYFLKPINPHYPIIDTTGEVHICGKVVGSFVPE
ncbi:S24 family peptidase [Pseudomonas alliivorans]|nr:S24 family peptidase [Pseudomonas alliivorans]